MIKAERHDLIMVELARRGAVSVQDLAKLLDVSTATVRRDILEMEDEGILARTHGGAALLDRRREIPFDAKLMAYLPEKRRIGAAAAGMLEPDMMIGCGGGTTIMQMVESIKRQSLRVVTNAVNVAFALRDADNVAVTLTGGTMRKRTTEMVGFIAERTMRDFNLDVAIIGVDGLHAAHGLTTYDSEEAYANRVLIGQAREVWILADGSKIDQVRPVTIDQLAVADLLITDVSAPAAFVRDAEALGVHVKTV